MIAQGVGAHNLDGSAVKPDQVGAVVVTHTIKSRTNKGVLLT